mgnify:FL=1
MFDAVIFDVDGTLVDSVDLHAEAWRRSFLRFGKTVPYTSIRQQIGKGGDQLLPVFFSDDELREFGEAMENFRSDLYKAEFLPQVRELFQRLRGDGIRLALASSAKGEELRSYKELTQIDDLVDEETSKDDVERSKPHPDIFEAALDRLGHPKPKEVIVIGDTPYDAEAARKAHLRSIGLLSGGFAEEELRDAGALRIFLDPADLLARYEEWVVAEVR